MIDQQFQELKFLCVAYLNSRDSFSKFDKEKLIVFAQFIQFSSVELLALDSDRYVVK